MCGRAGCPGHTPGNRIYLSLKRSHCGSPQCDWWNKLVSSGRKAQLCGAGSAPWHKYSHCGWFPASDVKPQSSARWLASPPAVFHLSDCSAELQPEEIDSLGGKVTRKTRGNSRNLCPRMGEGLARGHLLRQDCLAVQMSYHGWQG